MTSNDDINSKDRVAAKIALDVTQSANHDWGALPDEVELSNLYDDQLDAVRRDEVLGHIAHNPTVYQQWIELVESIEYQRVSTLQAEKVPWIAKIKGFIDSLNAKQWSGLGAGLASVMAIVFVSVIQMNSLNYLEASNELYAEFGGQWEYIPDATSLPTRSIGGVLEPELKADQGQYLLLGVQQGLNKLGDNFEIPGISSSQPVKITVPDLSKEQADVFKALGEVTAISYFKCQQQAPIIFYENANKLLDESIHYLVNVSDTHIAAFINKLPNYQFAKNNVCASVKPILYEARAVATEIRAK